jgi:hypothetical protein
MINKLKGAYSHTKLPQVESKMELELTPKLHVEVKQTIN